jgi:hypothetical protein
LRQLDGTTYNLGYLIKWDSDQLRHYNNGSYYPCKQPLPLWLAYTGQVTKIIPSGMVFSQGRNNYSVTNFPGASPQLVGREVYFYAQVAGTYRDGAEHGIRLDYGVPVRKRAVGILSAADSSTTNTVAVVP